MWHGTHRRWYHTLRHIDLNFLLSLQTWLFPLSVCCRILDALVGAHRAVYRIGPVCTSAESACKGI